MDVIAASGLVKSFGRTRALDGLDLTVSVGETHGFLAAAAGFGFLLGVVGVNMGGYVDAPQMRDWAARMGVRGAGDAFLWLIMFVLGQVVSVYAVATVLRLRREEVAGRADALLASPVGRWRWASSHLTMALAGPVVLLGVLGLAIGLGYGLAGGALAESLPRLWGRTMLTLPAVWVMVGIAVALYGVTPRRAAAATWALFGLFLLLELGWELQEVSPSVFALSPYAHVHWSKPVSPAALAGLTGLAVVLGGVGLAGLRRRDIG